MPRLRPAIRSTRHSRAAGGFPADFLESVYVGEQSGNLVESMAHLANLYQDQARAALNVLATVAGFAVWAVVAAIIIFLIFRLATFYLGAWRSRPGVRVRRT